MKLAAVTFLLNAVCAGFALAQGPIAAPEHVYRPAAVQASAGTASFNAAPSKIAASASILSPTPTSLVSGTITYICDPNIDAAVAGTCNYLNTAIAGIYANAFTNANARIYIQYGNTGLGSSTTGFLNLFSYAAFRAALAG